MNTADIVKRGQQRIHLLRKLNSFSVTRYPLSFYQSFLESLLCFSFICWFPSLKLKDKNSLYHIIKTCSKITGVKFRDLTSFCDQQILRKADKILFSPSHVLASEFSLLASGHHYVSGS